MIMKSLISDLKKSLSAPRNEGALQFSQHLQHDRHTALYMSYGYPTTEPSWGSMFPLVQGTGVHETIHLHMKDVCEEYLPEHSITTRISKFYTWTGTVDAFAKYDDQYWILDYKTISGPGMFFLGDEPKPEHLLQVSAYHAFKPEGDVKDWNAAVIYFPSSPDYKKNWEEPRMLEFQPIAKGDIVERMREVEKAIDLYRDEGILPPPPPPTFSWKKKPASRSWTKQYELLKKPHYTNLFCPWASLIDDPCGCSNATTEVCATWTDGMLTVEDGYDKLVEEIGEPE